MISLTWLKISLCIAAAYATQNDPGPRYFAQSTPSPIASKRGYVMKDVVLYLTPSQIRALEATQGLNKVVPYGKPSEDQNEKIKFSIEDLQKLEAELNRQLEYLRIYEKQNERPAEFKAPTPIVEPNTEKPIAFAPDYTQEQHKLPQPIPQPEINFYLPNEQEQKFKLPESYSYIKFFTDNVAQERSKVQAFQPFPREFKLGGEFEKTIEIQKDPIHQKQYKLIPYAFSEKSPEQLKQELVSQVPQFPSLFNQLHSEPSPSQQLAELIKSQNQDLELKNLEIQKEFSDIRYAAKFEDHKQASDYQRFVANIEKENTFAQAEALKKSPGVIIKKQESITKLKPSPLFKQFNNPQLKPLYVTGPLSFKGAQPAQIPIQVIQAIPNLKTEIFEAPRGELEIERYVPADQKKNEQFEISLNSPDKSTTTFRHVWKH